MDILSNINTVPTSAIRLDENWVSPSSLRSIILGDPCQVWLEHWGERFGYTRESGPYSYFDFICNKGNEFEDKWVREMCPPGTEKVCTKPCHAKSLDHVFRTLDLMDEGADVVWQGVLWHPTERLYGCPDLLARQSWLSKTFPKLESDRDRDDHYVVVDLKWILNIEDKSKVDTLAYAAAQVKVYTFMLAHNQRHMPKSALLITRDRVFDPVTVAISSELDKPLDPDLSGWRDDYLKIRRDGLTHLPWEQEWLHPNLRMHNDAPWHDAKQEIAARIAGGEPMERLYYLKGATVGHLKHKGYRSLDDLVDEDAEDLPLGETATATVQRAILEAQRTGMASPIPPDVVPQKKQVELFVDFEFFTNANVDMKREWPKLKGTPMVFMIGVGWEKDGRWEHVILTAESETRASERKLLREFHGFLAERGIFDIPEGAAVYSWSSAEKSQIRQAVDRHRVDWIRDLTGIPWVDLRKPFLRGPIAIPGATSFQLKSIAGALSDYDRRFAIEWPTGLNDGLRAMVAGWQMYKSPKPLSTPEYDLLSKYLNADIRALWQMLRWLRYRSSSS